MIFHVFHLILTFVVFDMKQIIGFNSINDINRTPWNVTFAMSTKVFIISSL